MALLGIWIALLVMLPSLGATPSSEEEEACGAVFCIGIRWEGREAVVYASSDLFLLAEGRPMALLFSLMLPETATVAAWKTGEGAQGLRLTAGELRQGVVKVLLDGILKPEQTPGEDTVILRILLEKREDSLMIRSETVFSFLQEDGSICTMNLRTAESEEEKASGGSGEADVSERETQACFPDPDMPEDTEESSDIRETHTHDETDKTEPSPPLYADRFMGCRETPAENGCFTVQLLFYGTSGVTPVICRRGDGWKLPEVTQVSESMLAEEGISPKEDLVGEEGGFWSLCTFPALSLAESLVFTVYTEQGSVSVLYEKGLFCGFHASNG